MTCETMREQQEKKFGDAEPIVLEIPSSAEYILLGRLVVSCAGQLAGFSPEDVYDLKLAVTEAATNVVRYAEVGSFRIEYRVLSEAVEVTVTDAGGGFDIEELSGKPGEHGGFGLTVIRGLVDDVTVDSTADGTRLKMVRSASPGT